MNEKHIDIVFQRSLDELKLESPKKKETKSIIGRIFGRINDNIFAVSRKRREDTSETDILLIKIDKDDMKIMKWHFQMDEIKFISQNKKTFKRLAHAIPITFLSSSNMIIQLQGEIS